MALYTDGLFPTPDDVNNEDPTLNTLLTATCNISGTVTPLTLCNQANAQCAAIIASKLQSVIGATNFNPSGGATSLHNAAVIWGVRAQSNVVRLRMGQVVVDDLYYGDGPNSSFIPGPLHTWIIYWAISLGYRKLMGQVDANLDRAKIKYTQYRQLTAGEKWSLLRSTGIPYVRVPFPAPGAIFEPGQGTWGLNNLSQVVQAGTTGGNYTVAITWVDQSSQSANYVSPLNKNNSESGPSMVYPSTFTDGMLQITLTAGHALSINITSLTPPNGQVSLPEASITGVSQGTHIATGWNIYIGDADGGSLYLQNAQPIPVATKTYTLTTDPVLTGYTMGRGQYPDANMPMADLMMRM